jgi:hypothetical protein
MNKIFLIYADEATREPAGVLEPGRLVPALEAAGATVQVHRLGYDRDAVLNAVAAGAMPVVVKARREG